MLNPLTYSLKKRHRPFLLLEHQVNKVDFSVSGLGLIKGSLTIAASYSKASKRRVNIEFKSAALVSQRLDHEFFSQVKLIESV